MTPLLWRSSRRYLARHPWQFGLSILGVALGVAVVVAIDLANASAERAFELSTEAVTGRTTHQLLGGPEGLPEELYRRLRLDLAVRPAAPVVEGYAWVPGPAAPQVDAGGEADEGPPPPGGGRAASGDGGRLLHLLGIDPFAEPPLRPYLSGLGGEVDLGPLLTRPGAVLLAQSTAAGLGLAVGDRFTVELGGRRQQALLVGTLSGGDDASRQALTDLLLADLSTAQELLGRTGVLSRIDLIVPPGTEGEAMLDRLGTALPPGVEVVRAAARAADVVQMTRAFRLNLEALALLALVCGAFLIYNTMTFSVVQRRGTLGALRALGVTRRQLLGLVLGEAALVGALGTAGGLLLGIVLGGGLVKLVAQTINDLYFALTVSRLALDPLSLAKGALLGLGAALAAALAPALEATAAPPRAVLSRSQLEERRRRAVPRLAAGGGALLALATLLLALPGKSLLAAFSGLFVGLLGAALLTPAATVLAARWGRPLLGAAFGFLGRMAAGGLAAALSRTAVAIATLTIAVALTVAMGVMVGSFRSTLVDWLGQTLQADVYASVPGAGRRPPEETLSPQLEERLRALPGVERVNSLLWVEVEGAAGRTQLRVLDLDRRGRAGFDFAAGDEATLWGPWQRGEAVLISEPLAYRRKLAVGDRLPLPTPSGQRAFPVAGIFYDYGSDRGVVAMSRSGYERYWPSRGVTGLAFFASPGVDPERLVEAVRGAAAEAGQRLLVRSNRRVREVSLAIFDRTFLITDVLRLLAALVAFVGVASALMALQLERARELGVLRANGLTPRQLRRLVLTQTGFMGLLSGLLSLPLGVAMAAVMIFIVNKRSFGWTLGMEVAPAVLAEALVLAVAAALLAGLYPALRMARTSPARALREE